MRYRKGFKQPLPPTEQVHTVDDDSMLEVLKRIATLEAEVWQLKQRGFWKWVKRLIQRLLS